MREEILLVTTVHSILNELLEQEPHNKIEVTSYVLVMIALSATEKYPIWWKEIWDSIDPKSKDLYLKGAEKFRSYYRNEENKWIERSSLQQENQ